jgi:Ni/Fe-hydrogenase subunit HybB-like protein
VILIFDLGRPDRFWGFVVYPNPLSPLYEVSWCVLLYSSVLTLEFLPAVLERARTPRALALLRRAQIPLVVAGVTLSVMHQSTLGTTFLALSERLHPLWFTPLLPLLFLVSSVGMGLSAVIVVAHLAGRAFRKPPDGRLLAGLARLSVWVWCLYALLVAGRLAFAGQLQAAFALDRASVWFLLEIAGGVVAPIVLFSSPRLRANPTALFVVALLVIAGVALNRFNATLTAQRVPAGAGYTPHWMELAIQIGVLAAGVLAWYTIARLLPVLPDRGAALHGGSVSPRDSVRQAGTG